MAATIAVRGARSPPAGVTANRHPLGRRRPGAAREPDQPQPDGGRDGGQHGQHQPGHGEVGEPAGEVAAVRAVDRVRAELPRRPERKDLRQAPGRVGEHLRREHDEQRERALELARQDRRDDRAERRRDEHRRHEEQEDGPRPADVLVEADEDGERGSEHEAAPGHRDLPAETGERPGHAREPQPQVDRAGRGRREERERRHRPAESEGEHPDRLALQIAPRRVEGEREQDDERHDGPAAQHLADGQPGDDRERPQRPAHRGSRCRGRRRGRPGRARAAGGSRRAPPSRRPARCRPGPRSPRSFPGRTPGTARRAGAGRARGARRARG